AGGIPSITAPNGTVVALTEDGPKAVEHIETGRQYLDGTQIYGAMDGIVRERLRMSWRGVAVVNLVFDERNELMGDAWVETRGLFTALDGEEDALQGKLEMAVTQALNAAKRGVRGDDEQVEKLVKGKVNTLTNQLIGKKPEITVMINRID
ncbi:MAG: ribonuclease J, partial [Pseudomonadota bacterium]